MKKRSLKKSFGRLVLGTAVVTSTIIAVHAADDAIESRVDATLSQMTSQEKFQRLGGEETMFVRPISRLGLDRIVMSDAGVGVRCYGEATSYPAAIIAAATFDKQLLYDEGVALGRDSRARGVHFLLAPGVNMYRSPQCGRNFEYFGEDPVLTGSIATQLVLGIQSQGVGATVKHFAVNNYETNRSSASSNVDERTLRELYLPAFKQVVQKGHVAAVMDSYNRINGAWATDNHHLNLDILKGEWGFDGILMSDWGATHGTVSAANAGLDLDMDVDGGKYFTESKLQGVVDDGRVSMDVINDKIRRQLRTIYRFGWAKRPQLDSTIARDDANSGKVALKLAREGMVMLKNLDNVMPIANSKHVMVIGPNADVVAAGGGSSQTIPFRKTTIYQALKAAMPEAEVEYTRGMGVDMGLLENCYVERGSNAKGFKVEWFNNPNLEGNPDYTGTAESINYVWGVGRPATGIHSDFFSGRVSGVVRTSKPGENVNFAIKADDGFRVKVDGKVVIDEWRPQAPLYRATSIVFDKAGDHDVVIEYYEYNATASLQFSCYSDGVESLESRLSRVDYAVVCVGFDIDTEVEGQDRTFTLPDGQDSLINLVAANSRNTIVVINAGGAVDVSRWANNVQGIIYAGYGGQSTGQAVSDIITGAVNPSGKLPFSWEKQEKDNPVYGNVVPGAHNAVKYSEGLFTGYRYYDTNNVDVQYPFGYGLSYTSFDYSNLKVKGSGHNYTITVDVMNSGTRAGAESVQLYVEPQERDECEPVHKLGDFGKTAVLQPGETATVTMTLDEDAFSTWNDNAARFEVNAGKYDLRIGSSSRDLRLAKTINVK